MEKITYASAVGSLIYVVVCTRLDIAHIVEIINRFFSNLNKKYWIAIKWILRYLKATDTVYLCFSKGKSIIDRYVNMTSLVI